MEFYISEDKTRLDVKKIHHEVSSVYWGLGRTWEQTLMTIEKSICFGMFLNNGEQIANARMMTDGLTFTYIMDVIVFDPYKGKGLGTKMMEYILDRSDVKQVNTVALKTMDAHKFYESFGFKRIGDSEIWMSIERVKYNM